MCKSVILFFLATFLGRWFTEASYHNITEDPRHPHVNVSSALQNEDPMWSRIFYKVGEKELGWFTEIAGYEDHADGYSSVMRIKKTEKKKVEDRGMDEDEEHEGATETYNNTSIAPTIALTADQEYQLKLKFILYLLLNFFFLAFTSFVCYIKQELSRNEGIDPTSKVAENTPKRESTTEHFELASIRRPSNSLTVTSSTTARPETTSTSTHNH